MQDGADVIYRSQSIEWETPQKIFDILDWEFHFTLDPCSTDANAKCRKHYTIADDGLKQSWGGETVFCNPPYGRQIGKWVRKALHESRQEDTTVVLLIPARTDTDWFHRYVYGRAEIRFIRGRLRYGGADMNAPFPTMVVIFR